MTVIGPVSAEKNYARKLGQDEPIYLIMLKVCIQNKYNIILLQLQNNSRLHSLVVLLIFQDQ